MLDEDQRQISNGKRSIKWGCGGCAGVLVAGILLAVFSQSHYMFVQEPMVDAARDGDINTVNRLINSGADVNGEADDEGTGTALIGASAEGHADVVRLLIRRGADVNKSARYFGKNETPLQAAAGYPKIVAILKKAGATE